MPTPTWVTQENVRFNGTLDNAVVVKTVGDDKTVILWDNLSSGNQTLLESVVNAYGGDLPFAGAVNGYQVVNVGGAITDGDETGLASTGNTAGTATVDVGGDKASGTATGLSNAAGTSGRQLVLYADNITESSDTGLAAGIAATAGYQTADFNGGVAGGDPTGLTDDIPATNGTQAVTFSGPITGATATGLVAETAYGATVTVDGTPYNVNIADGATAATMEDVADAVRTAIGDSGMVTIEGNTFVVTSGTTGASSTILITDSVSSPEPLFGSMTGFSAISAAVPGENAVVTTYEASVAVDGVATPISIDGGTAQTFTTLIQQLNANLVNNAQAAIVEGNIVITSDSTGASSTIAITDDSLFAALTGFVAFEAAVPGEDGDVTTYTATITIDGVATELEIDGATAETFGDLVDAINAQLGADGTAAFTPGEITITSSTQGAASRVNIADGTLFNSTTGFQQIIPPINGRSTARSYSATFVIDGSVIKTVTVAGSAAQTFGTLITEINNDLGAAATAALTNGNIVVTSATTGATSSVQISDSGFLFASLAGYASIASAQGAARARYTAVIDIDGVRTPLVVFGDEAETYADLITAIEAGTSAAVTVEIADGNLKIASASGTASGTSIRIIDQTLFRSLTDFVGFDAGVIGAEDFEEAMYNTLAPTGDHNFLINAFPTQVVGLKPPVPPFGVTKRPEFTYWGGTPAVWRYLLDDSEVNPSEPE